MQNGRTFTSDKRDITADFTIVLFEPALPPCGHSDPEEEEGVIVYWTEFIQKVEGTY